VLNQLFRDLLKVCDLFFRSPAFLVKYFSKVNFAVVWSLLVFPTFPGVCEFCPAVKVCAEDDIALRFEI